MFSLLSHIHLHAKSQKHYENKDVKIKEQTMPKRSFEGLVDNLHSSINKMSFSFKLVKIAAKSPDLVITGPEVERKPTPNSLAMICANVVFPSPGGPTKRAWSMASCRFEAERINLVKLSLLSI